MDFGEATRLRAVGDGDFAWEVPDGWQQGRGAWGGLVAGGVLRAVALVDPERTVRTVSIHMAAPLPDGPAVVRVQSLRVGSAMSTWAVTVTGADGELAAHAVVITGDARVPDLAAAEMNWGTLRAPELPAWQDVAVLPAGIPGLPVFMQHVQLRIVSGIPMAGPDSRTFGYVAFADGQPWDAQRLLSIVDAWYPTALVVLDAQRPLASVTYAAHLLIDPASVPTGEPLAYEASMSAAHEGFTTETRRLWTLDGRLAVENHQAIAVIR